VVYGLSRLGSDVSGNLILGDLAFEQWQAQKLSPPESMAPLQPRAIGKAYVRLAEQALGAGVLGSSTAGEFPKFPALREKAGSATPHVLVKFSGSEVSGAVQRWADLLVCEHLALAGAASLPGVVAAHSRVLAHGRRCFLEVERFDRHGLFGRSPLVSLGTLNAALVGDGTADWTRLAAKLQALGWLDASTVQRIAHLWWFGRLIANSDMHTGNLSFQPQLASGLLALAPAYDMLPMLYAPLAGGELPVRNFEPPLPLPPQRSTWMTACSAALEFWWGAAQDTRISASFQTLCRANAGKLQNLADRV
jgi:serine/threonine protein kinase HipA of HipAB toxin-antitoxin module